MANSTHTYTVTGYDDNSGEHCWETLEFAKRFTTSKLNAGERNRLADAILGATNFVGVTNVVVRRVDNIRVARTA